MKKTALFILAAVLMVVCVPAFAQQFPDVPTDHWAYPAIQDLASKGIIQGYPDGTFSGKRALTRYEFAEALSKAIPVIAGMAGTGEGKVGPQGPQGVPGPAGAPGVGAEQLANFQKLVNEFQAELAAQGADIKALKADVAALGARVKAVEDEQKRVRINGEVNIIPRGFVVNDGGYVVDRDGWFNSGNKHVLSNTVWNTDYQLGITGRVSDDVNVYTLIDAGNYNYYWPETTDQQFTLWYAYANAGLNMGPLGKVDLRIGRQPLQLTPYTLKMVAPDSYAYVGIISNGDFPMDGVVATGNIGSKVKVTAFAAKSAAESGDFDNYAATTEPTLIGENEISQLAGARAIISTGFLGNVGLTYVQNALDYGREHVYGADVNTTFGKLGFGAEWAKTDPSDAAEAGLGLSSTKSNAYTANLSYQFGQLGVKGGYTIVERNFDAPGYWSRFGRAVNLTNVKGASANLNYNFGKNLSLVAEGQWLQPNQDSYGVFGREAIDSDYVVATSFDQMNYYKAGVKYALTANNSVDLGFEEVQWKPDSGDTTKERYVTIGFGHTFNPNASLKLLYQIVEFEQGDVFPYTNTDADYRGGVAAAQFQLKY